MFAYGAKTFVLGDRGEDSLVVIRKAVVLNTIIFVWIVERAFENTREM